MDPELARALYLSLQSPPPPRRRTRRGIGTESLMTEEELSLFVGMSQSDLRYHKYAELMIAWQQEHGAGPLPAATGYKLNDDANSWADLVIQSRKAHW